MARLRLPDPRPVDQDMPERLARFEVTDWCDPTAEPPEWWQWQNAHADALFREVETVEWYWYCHARLAFDRARRSWHEEHDRTG
jgi:hypothetical protein